MDNQALSQEALDTLLRSSKSTADLQANRAEVTSLWQVGQLLLRPLQKAVLTILMCHQ